MNSRSLTMHLYLIGKINPKAWDAIIPHGPRTSPAMRDYAIAQALKGFAKELTDTKLIAKLTAAQKILVKSAAERLVSHYDDDDWCWTWPHPEWRPPPIPWLEFTVSPFASLASSVDLVAIRPQPLPPREIGAYVGLLAEATSLASVGKELRSISNDMMKLR